jgi:hypothetical protein
MDAQRLLDLQAEYTAANADPLTALREGREAPQIAYEYGEALKAFLNV